MFSIPIDTLTFQDVSNFCQTRTREGLILDYKLDFPRRLDKTIASFANTYGGHILIGVDETKTGEPVLPIQGVALQPGLRERVVATALDAIYPPVYPEVRVVEFQSPGAQAADRAVVVIRVHESEAAAHAVDGGKSVYVRVDNISEQFTRQATTEEIEWLGNKRKRPLELKKRMLEEAKQRASNYLPSYRAAQRLSTAEPPGKYVLWAVPTFPRSELAPPSRLLELSRTWPVRVTNFDFPVGMAVPIADGVRHPQSPVLNYWYTEVNRFGLVYTEIGFTGRAEESRGAISGALVASLTIASLEFSLNLYETLGYFGLVDFHFGAAPTLDCYPYISEDETYRDYRTLENSIKLEFTSSVKEARASVRDRATQIYREFFWAFGLNIDATTARSHFRRFGFTD